MVKRLEDDSKIWQIKIYFGLAFAAALSVTVYGDYQNCIRDFGLISKCYQTRIEQLKNQIEQSNKVPFGIYSGFL